MPVPDRGAGLARFTLPRLTPTPLLADAVVQDFNHVREDFLYILTGVTARVESGLDGCTGS